jgi:hypothetical protein
MKIRLIYRRDIEEGGFAAPAIMMILAAASTAVSVYGAVASGEAAKDAADYNAAVERNNALAATQQAEFDAQQIRDKNRRLVAAQRSAFAASGIDPNSGSPLSVYQDTAVSGELEALVAIYTGKTSANAATARATLSKMRGESAQTAGYIGGFSSLLSGASRMTEIANNPSFKR